MDLNGEYSFEAPRQAVWDALQNPEVIAQIMPGTEKLEEIGPGEFQGVLKLKVGPVQGRFNGKVHMTDLDEPQSFKMQVDGKGPVGFMKGTGAVRLEENGSQTVMTYEGKAQVGGRIASVGQRLMDASAKSITRQSLDSLRQYLEATVAVETAVSTKTSSPIPTPTATPKPQIHTPSQTQVAMNLAKDVAADYLSDDLQPLILGGLAIIILLLLSINQKLAKLKSSS